MNKPHDKEHSFSVCFNMRSEDAFFMIPIMKWE